MKKENFTKPIQDFFKDMKNWDWKNKYDGVLFFRDFSYLPISSPKDIDLIIEQKKQIEFIKKVKERTIKFSLYFNVFKTNKDAFILIFDLNANNKGRSWAFLEIRDSITLNNKISLSFKNIKKTYDKNLKIPIPNNDWLLFFNIIQAIRTNNKDKIKNMNTLSDSDLNSSKKIFNKVLNLKLNFSNRIESFEKIRAKIFVKKEKTKDKINLFFKIKRFFFKNFYLIPSIKPISFSIIGPDGVGKTTTILEVKKIFDKLPIDFINYHHITSWKYNKSIINNTSKKEQLKESYLHKILRYIYRNFLSDAIKENYVIAIGYHKYIKNINNLMINDCLNNIILFDRYIYDLCIKNMLDKKGSRLVHGFFIKYSTKLLKIFNLSDEPQNIFLRKQELDLDKIEQYQKEVLFLAKKYKLPIQNLVVTNQKPEQIAYKIATRILNQIEDDLFNLFRNFNTSLK
jgi:hypothetical protein